jgi:DNA-binding helix-hairpin-helix protein with protein kinase domain
VGSADLVAKIYLSPVDSDKAAKLQTMVSRGTEALTKLAAWPSDLVLTSPKGRIAGLIMRRIERSHPIHQLYTPKSRLQEFPRATWPFLIHTATNVARAFSIVHSHGIIIGDVNEGNVRVNDAALVALIDCDSFQIVDNGRQFICEVGVSTYTPPELQGKNQAVLRTENHDNFGLALMVFQLLFMGRHPFAGRFLGSGDMPVERAIKECRFAFSADNQKLQMAPPPNALQLADVPVGIANLFESAFSATAAHGNTRPTALEWIEALEAFSRELVRCGRTSSHHYYRQLNRCPWCAIEHGTAIVLFLQWDVAQGTGANVAQMWAQIIAVPHPGPRPRLRGKESLDRRLPSAEAKIAGRWRRISLGASVFAVVGGITLAAIVSASPGGFFMIVFLALWMAVVIGKKARRAPRFEKPLLNSKAQYTSLQEQWQRDAGDSAFQEKFRALEHAKKRLESLPAIRQQRVVALEKNSKEIQLERWLDKHYLRDAVLSGIGPGRKALLSSYGIDTAADLTWQALESVHGIGPMYSTALMDWRDTVAQRFVYNPSLGIDKSDLAKLDREVASQRTALERALAAGPAELAQIKQRILEARKSIQEEMPGILEQLLQAEADWRAC